MKDFDACRRLCAKALFKLVMSARKYNQSGCTPESSRAFVFISIYRGKPADPVLFLLRLNVAVNTIISI